VQSRLGAHFEISGLNELDPNDLDDLARRMSGRPPRADGEDAPLPQPEPEVETVPFTEEEYQRNKAARERMGIFHIETVPAEEELDRMLRKGMSHAEVAGIFGRPSSKSENPEYRIYDLAPEKLAENPDRQMVPAGLKVD